MFFSGKASQHLRKYDEAIDYFKKAVKLCMKSKDMKKSDLIGCYENLLEAQVRGKNYREAAQTVKKIKIYNLNSEVTTDLDLADLAAEARSVEFCTSKNCTPHPVRSRELVPDSILRLYLVAKICRWKAEIHKAFEGCKAFQLRNFQPRIFNPRIFNPRIFNPKLQPQTFQP